MWLTSVLTVLCCYVQDGNGFGSYLVIVVFKGVYPNAFGEKVSYDFSYT